MNMVKGTMNRIELLGNLGADPEMRFTPGGKAVCTFRVATKRYASRTAEGERTYETDWTTVEVWDYLAERCNDMLHKGSRVMVVGSLRTDSWEDRETGQKRFKAFVRADEVLPVERRQGAPESVLVTVGDEEEDLPF